MKTKIVSMIIVALVPATFVTSCSQPPPPVGKARISYTKGVPGGTIVQTLEQTATVIAVDAAKGRVTFQEPDEENITLKVAPNATKLDQLRSGDRINVTMTLTMVTLFGNDVSSGGTSTGARQKIARIAGLDSQNRTVTLQFVGGTTATLPLRDDVDLRRLRIGEQITFRVTDMLVIRIQKLP